MNVNKTSTTYPYIQGRLAYNSSPSSQFGKGSYILMFVQYDFLHFVSDYFCKFKGSLHFQSINYSPLVNNRNETNPKWI